MSTEFKFLMIDANQAIEAQQNIVRDLVTAKVDLGRFASQKEVAA